MPNYADAVVHAWDLGCTVDGECPLGEGEPLFLVKCSLNNRSLACTAYTVFTFKARSNHELLMSHKLVQMLRAEERIGKLWSNAYVILSLSQIYWLWEFYSILSSILDYKVCPYTPGVVCIQVLRVMRHEKRLVFIFHVSVNMTKCTGGNLILHQKLHISDTWNIDLLCASIMAL